MRRLTTLVLVALLASLLAGCQPVSRLLSTVGGDPDAACAGFSRSDDSYPLSEPGPFAVSSTAFAIEDPSREKGHIGVVVWYPAVAPGDSGRTIQSDAEPDPGGAPYPLIVSSAMTGEILAPTVVSHGFVWASVAAIYPYRKMNAAMIDHPLDILYLLEQVASKPPEVLRGLIDAERTGAIGYSFDGYNALAMSGARIDPAYYLAQCPDPDPTTAAAISDLSAFDCG
ncbi:MAG: alpha/beta hydrolase family protein, partial [Anaerolineae bacterium]